MANTTKQKSAAKKRKAKRRVKRPPPAYFLSLTVEGIRCFGPEQTLDLSDGNGRPAQWTVLLGDNGTGKTTLLERLAILLVWPDPPEENLGRALIQSAAIRVLFREPFLTRQDAAEGSFSAEVFSGALLSDNGGSKAPAHLGIRCGPWMWVRSGGAPSKEVPGLCCYGYGAGRHMGRASLSEEESDDPTATLFSVEAPLRSAEEWLLQVDYAANRESQVQAQAQAERDQVMEILTKVLPDVEKVQVTGPTEERQRPWLELRTPYGWVTMDALSLGYKTMIAWMVDLAARLFERYPDSDDPLAEPAVVLLDEIDLHLHPKWQRTLMQYLSERFVNTQFIVTAHSPLLVQAAGDANIAVLRREGDHVVIDNNPETIRGWRIDQVLTSDLFDLATARPPHLEPLLAERKKLLSKARLTGPDKKRLAKLEAEIGDLPTGETPEDIEAMAVIRQAADELRRRRRKPG